MDTGSLLKSNDWVLLNHLDVCSHPIMVGATYNVETGLCKGVFPLASTHISAFLEYFLRFKAILIDLADERTMPKLITVADLHHLTQLDLYDVRVILGVSFHNNHGFCHRKQSHGPYCQKSKNSKPYHFMRTLAIKPIHRTFSLEKMRLRAPNKRHSIVSLIYLCVTWISGLPNIT